LVGVHVQVVTYRWAGTPRNLLARPV